MIDLIFSFVFFLFSFLFKTYFSYLSLSCFFFGGKRTGYDEQLIKFWQVKCWDKLSGCRVKSLMGFYVSYGEQKYLGSPNTINSSRAIVILL